ncbi:MAG: VanZ family protein [Ruminococcus sp.]|uniref:VanZ family protein n=1 Tax=Ruminococcus sp. TaxID=41978 RepID=UPI001B7846BD|nr:VanZ family protein [Ruminococcus sp.]MBP5579771.1 VanZ family protein [Ruminococcus sp.]
MRLKKTIVFTLFAVYILLALNLLFFIRSSMRGFYTYGEYFRENTNFVPFRTVIEFIGYIRDRDIYYLEMSKDNLVGNILIFMPLGVFLPAVWKRQRRSAVFFLTASAVIIGVEMIQFITMRGACDIDDYILNFFGAVIGYTLSRLKIVRKLMFVSKE